MEPHLETEKFDILILGSGEAGKYIAWTQASSGKRVALVERQYVGGSCPNIACLPSKNFVHSAKVVKYLRDGNNYGASSLKPGPIDMKVIRERKREMVRGLASLHEARFKQTGVDFILGVGKFTAPKTIAVELASGAGRLLTADVVIVSTGSYARVDDTNGLREAEPLTHVGMLEIDQVPAHLIVLGGGYVGLEFAQAMRRLGSQVTIIEHNSRLLKREDEDVSLSLQDILSSEGVTVHTSSTIDRVEGLSGTAITLTGTKSGQPLTISGTHLFVATGRIPNTSGIGLEHAGIEVTISGTILVDEHLRTTAQGVFAVGDCAGSPNFTHIAYDDYRIVQAALSGIQPVRSTDGRQTPYTVFTDPELARVGLNETEASKRGIKYRLAKLPMSAFLRTRTTGETYGFAKALISDSDDQILGFSAIGAGVGELLPSVQLVMAARLPYASLRDLIVVHPTLCEGLVYLFSNVEPRGKA